MKTSTASRSSRAKNKRTFSIKIYKKGSNVGHGA